MSETENPYEPLPSPYNPRDLDELEGEVVKGLRHVRDALTEIRDRELFRQLGYDYWHEYLNARWVNRNSDYRWVVASADPKAEHARVWLDDALHGEREREEALLIDAAAADGEDS